MRFLILTAIEEEYVAARDHLDEIDEIVCNDGTILEEGIFHYESSKIRICLAKTGMGNIKSGIISSNVLSKIKPDYLFYIGIAGGIKDVSIGDVVVAEKFYYYENGKATDKFSSRPESRNSLYKIIQRATLESRSNHWRKLCKLQSILGKVIIGNICSGEKVIATTDMSSPYSPYGIIKEHFGDSHAVDMESGGIITSSWINSFYNIAVIRGISDLLINKEATDSDGSRSLAIDNAFAFAFHLIRKLYLSEKPRTAVVISIDADEDILDTAEFSRLISALRRLSKDESLSIKFLTAGSINLHLTCAATGYQELQRLFNAGVISTVEGYRILKIELEEDPNTATIHPHNTLEIYSREAQTDLFELLSKRNSPGIIKNDEYDSLYFTSPQLEGEPNNHMKLYGKDVIVWSLNNYLGLATHSDIRKADVEATKQYGLAAPMGARLMNGNTKFHDLLEQNLAEFVSKEDACLLNYGYQGIVSLIDALCTKDDVIVYDSQSHPSIIDGIRLHFGRHYVFKHNDLNSLEAQLKLAIYCLNYENVQGGILVITEGIFGLYGDQAALRGITSLKNNYNFRLLVNDSHGFGILGETGAGTGEEQSVQDKIDLYFSTFSKSMASLGAFIAGDRQIINYIRRNMRSQLFSKGTSTCLVIGNLKRLEVLRNNPELRKSLWKNVRKLRWGLEENGFSVQRRSSPIIPIQLKGSVNEAIAMTIDLRKNYGVFASVVTFPAISKGHIIFRLLTTALHSDEDIEKTIYAFISTRLKLEQGVYLPETQDDLVEVSNVE